MEDYLKSADGVRKLLNHVLYQIELSVDNFYIFTGILAAEEDTKPLVSKLSCSIGNPTIHDITVKID